MPLTQWASDDELTAARLNAMVDAINVLDGGDFPATTYWSYNDSNDEFEGLEFYFGGVRKLLLADRGMIFGPYNEWNNSSQDRTVYGLWEWTSPVDGNNNPKTQLPSLVLVEPIGDPAEINFENRGNLTAGSAFTQNLAGSHVGMLVWWGRIASGADKEKLVQISAKSYANVTATTHGGFLGFMTAPNGTDTDPIPRMTIAPNGNTIIDKSLPSADASVWSPTYIDGFEGVLSLRDTANPLLSIKSYKTIAGADRGDIAVLFGANSTGIDNSNTGLVIRTLVDGTGPFRSQVDFLSNVGNSLVENIRIDAAGQVKVFRGLEVEWSGTDRIKVDATGLGFFAATPVAQRAAYTQTFATASRTVADNTSSAMSGIVSSTTGSVLAEPSAGYVQAEMQQNFRRIQDQINLIRTDISSAKQNTNALIDDSQALGFAT